MPAIDPTFQMWATFALIIVALGLYMVERIAIELTSLGVICVLLLLYYVFPLPGPDGGNLLGPERLLAGFANPALLTVVALLVIGQGLARTGILDQAALLVFARGGSAWRSITIVLVTVLAVSAFLNNIPVVVIFIPIMQALSERLGRSASGLMMPLSFAAILGGMTTLIGSSTNLLVSGSLVDLGLPPLGFFDFTVPGMVMAAAGIVYVVLVVPRLLPDRASLASELVGSSGKQFIAQVAVAPNSKLIGESAVAGFFPRLRDITVRMIQRREHAVVPPFEDFVIRPGDVLVLAATRKALTEALQSDRGLLGAEADGAADDIETHRPAGQVLAEVMVTPASRMIGQNLEQIGFRYKFNCIVLGLQRRSRMIRARVSEIRLEAGDVLLIQGPAEDIHALRGNPDVLLMEWSATDLPSPYHARRAILIFLAVIATAATGLLPIVVSALSGAAAMIAVGCLNIRQAARAIDRNVVMTIAAALALGVALQESGGAAFLADGLVEQLAGAKPSVVLSAFFLLVALLSNVISTKACAVLFTPVAVGIAGGLGVDPTPFAIAVVFGANCSFASPIGYQTNILVMGPGHYRFADFVRAGLPLVFVLWITFTLFVPGYYGLD